jgi:putative membrane protein
MVSLMRARAAASAVSLAGLVLGAGLLTAVPAAYAGGPVSAQPASVQDITWVQGNAQTDLAEIALGKMAEQRALRPATKTLARTIMSDHEKALAQLRTVAAETSITLPTAPSATQQAQAARLMTVSAGQFDAMFESALIQGHELSISQTRSEIASGASSTVKNFASAYLPTAEHHLMLTEAAYAALTGSRPGAPGVSAGTGGMAATRPADDAPWLAAGAAGALLLAGTGAFGMRRRLTSR